jgi:hypothetical protein
MSASFTTSSPFLHSPDAQAGGRSRDHRSEPDIGWSKGDTHA